jgi:hypothetical protein|tara:strand:- start:5103 stop:5498 length:396 start_codon:yes stop_codon:yes gene_type:complete
MLPLSADCQSDKICVDRYILERVANKLDSFDISKKLQEQCLRFRDSCFSLTSTQQKVIGNQDVVIGNQKTQIGKLQDIELEHNSMLEVNDEYIKHLTKEKKRLKTKYTISLVGGGVLTVGLTTALLISLLQ